MKKIIRLVLLAHLALVSVLFHACTQGSQGGSNQNANNANASQPQAPAATASQPASQPTLGSIKIGSRPAGAAVLLISEEGGAGQPQPRGSTPATITGLQPGKYAVHLEKPGYKAFQKSVEVKANETTSITADLKKQ